MAVESSFIRAVAGEWTQLCQLRETRRALRLQAMTGGMILSPSTAGPVVTGVLGPIASGLYQSIESVGGVPQLALSDELDDDLVRQAWFGWPIPSIAPPPLTIDQAVFQLANPTTHPIARGAPAIMYVAAMTADTVPVQPTLTSAVLGLIAPFRVTTLADGLGDSAIMVEWWFFSPTGTDSLTVDAGGFSNLVAMIISGPGGTIDVTGTASATNANDVTITASGPDAAADEMQTAAVVYFDGSGGGTWSSPWQDLLGPGNFASPSGTIWALNTAFNQLPVVTTPTTTFAFGNPPSDGKGSVNAFTVSSGSSAATVVAVYEAFDIVQPAAPERRFPVELPRLDADAIKALHDLIRRIQSPQGVSE